MSNLFQEKKRMILLDPHITQSRIYKQLSEEYQVQVYGGYSDLPEETESWIVSRWQLVDGVATDIPVKYRTKLMVIDESASIESWESCMRAKITYLTDIGHLLNKLSLEMAKEEEQISQIKSIPENKPIHESRKSAKQEAVKDPFAREQIRIEEEPKQLEVSDPPKFLSKKEKELIVVTHKKGGTGKTSVTQTAARLVAERGQKVLVIELDPDGGHLAVRLDIFAKATINLLNHGYPFEQLIERRSIRAVVIDYLLSPDFSKREVIPPYIVKKLINWALQEYDVIFIDCGVAWDDTIQAAVEEATQVWMVSTPDDAALVDGRVLYQKMIQAGVDPTNIVHIVNKSRKGKGVSLQKVQSQVPVAKVFLLPEDPKVQAAQDKKTEPVDCNFGKKLREMVDEVIQIKAIQDDEEEEKEKWWVKIPIIGRLLA